MNVTQPLPNELNIMKPNGELLKQKVQYEWMPKFCHNCYTFGHYVVDCPKDATTFQEPAKAVRRKKKKEMWKWKEKPGEEITVESTKPEIVDKKKKLQLEVVKQKSVLDLAILAARANALIRIHTGT
ncbi:hypothetical protein P3S68_031051 [Capsicum galapagoense]